MFLFIDQTIVIIYFESKSMANNTLQYDLVRRNQILYVPFCIKILKLIINHTLTFILQQIFSRARGKILLELAEEMGVSLGF